jgi:hypothetical protein
VIGYSAVEKKAAQSQRGPMRELLFGWFLTIAAKRGNGRPQSGGA